jgi:hypothetical protein
MRCAKSSWKTPCSRRRRRSTPTPPASIPRRKCAIRSQKDRTEDIKVDSSRNNESEQASQQIDWEAYFENYSAHARHRGAAAAGR